jgi:hypothetical protein
MIPSSGADTWPLLRFAQPDPIRILAQRRRA